MGDDVISFVAVILLIGGGVLFPLRSIKSSVLKNSKRMGLFSVVGHSPWRTRRLLIVGYHGVSPPNSHGVARSEQLFRPLTRRSDDQAGPE